MSNEGNSQPSGRVVDLIEDVDVATRVFRRGTRGLGDACKLTLSLNGDERLHFNEEASDKAPAQLVVDIRMPASEGERTFAALAARPWAFPEQPVIIFPVGEEGSRAVGYLVRSEAIDRVLSTIAAELDLPDLLIEPRHSTLDAGGLGG